MSDTLDATTDDHYDPESLNAESIIVIITCAISFYNSIELLLLIFVTFKRWHGLYFWSLFLASLAVIPYTLGYVIMFFRLGPSAAGLAVNNIGWWVLITGQSVVLYSRLHLVVNDRRILRAVLIMIIVDAIIFHIPTTILNFVANFAPNPDIALAGYEVYEKLQMTGFCVQEFIISGIYIWKTVQLLNVVPTIDAKRTMWQLFSINVIIVGMDIGLLTIEYCNYRVYEQVFKGVFYSVKLKLEYAILGKLVELVEGGHKTLSDAFQGDSDPAEFVDKSRSTSLAGSPQVTQRKKSSAMSKPLTQHPKPSEKDSDRSPEQTQLNGAAEAPRGLEHALSTISSTDEDEIREDPDDDLYATAVRQMTRGS